MGKNLEEQMRLSLRAILSKQMTGEGHKHNVVMSFVSDDSGFPLTGLKRSEKGIVDMNIEDFEQICAFLPQIWDVIKNSSQVLENLEENSEISHLTIGFKNETNSKPYLEMMVTRLDELYLSSIYYLK